MSNRAIKTADLSGLDLDRAVHSILHPDSTTDVAPAIDYASPHSSAWLGIADQAGILCGPSPFPGGAYAAGIGSSWNDAVHIQLGATRAEAALRCFAASRMGLEVTLLDKPPAAARKVVENIKLQRTSAEHGFDDFDVTGHPEGHRVTVGHGLQRGGMFNVYGPESTKRGATWCGSVEASLASFWKVSQESIQVCMDLREIDKRIALAEEEFDQYEFGDGVTVASRDNWDVTDQNDLTLIVYINGDDDAPDADSERVSFHVRFNADGSVDDAYGLLIRNGSYIGFRPENQTAADAVSEDSTQQLRRSDLGPSGP